MTSLSNWIFMWIKKVMILLNRLDIVSSIKCAATLSKLNFLVLTFWHILIGFCYYYFYFVNILTICLYSLEKEISQLGTCLVIYVLQNISHLPRSTQLGVKERKYQKHYQSPESLQKIIFFLYLKTATKRRKCPCTQADNCIAKY